MQKTHSFKRESCVAFQILCVGEACAFGSNEPGHSGITFFFVLPGQFGIAHIDKRRKTEHLIKKNGAKHTKKSVRPIRVGTKRSESGCAEI